MSTNSAQSVSDLKHLLVKHGLLFAVHCHFLWVQLRMISHTPAAHPHTHGVHPHTHGVHPHTHGVHPHTHGVHPHTHGVHPHTHGVHPVEPFCTQLTKTYVVEPSCSQLLLIESATYIYAQDPFVSYQQCRDEPLRYHSFMSRIYSVPELLLYIYTSGTTGPPKAAKIPNHRWVV